MVRAGAVGGVRVSQGVLPDALGHRRVAACPVPPLVSLEPQIWNHPDVLYEALQKENLANEQDLDVEELGSAGTSARCPSQGTKVKGEDSALASSIGEATNSRFLQGVGFNPFQERGNNIVTYEWVSQAVLRGHRTAGRGRREAHTGAGGRAQCRTRPGCVRGTPGPTRELLSRRARILFLAIWPRACFQLPLLSCRPRTF